MPFYSFFKNFFYRLKNINPADNELHQPRFLPIEILENIHEEIVTSDFNQLLPGEKPNPMKP